MSSLIVLGIKILEWMFLVGLAGSTIVILISGVEDVETMLEFHDETGE
jgi:hypothetical protein